jgi:hypothetical protein
MPTMTPKRIGMRNELVLCGCLTLMVLSVWNVDLYDGWISRFTVCCLHASVIPVIQTRCFLASKHVAQSVLHSSSVQHRVGG